MYPHGLPDFTKTAIFLRRPNDARVNVLPELPVNTSSGVPTFLIERDSGIRNDSASLCLFASILTYTSEPQI